MDETAKGDKDGTSKGTIEGTSEGGSEGNMEGKFSSSNGKHVRLTNQVYFYSKGKLRKL